MSAQNNEVRIGIDAKWYFDGPPSGKMVIRNLVNEICQLKSKLKFYIILDKKCKSLYLDLENSNVEKVYVWNGNNLLSNVFFVPFVAQKYNLDVILYQTSVSFWGKHKKIAYIHDLIYISHPQYFSILERLYLKPLKILTRFADFIITVSNSEKNRFSELEFTDKEVLVLHHGYDFIFNKSNTLKFNSSVDLQEKYNLPDKYILYVGRINTRKNIPNLLKSLTCLKDKEIKLVLVGNREWKIDNIETLLKHKNLSNRIIQTGSVTNEELAILYANAYIFCFPSFEEAFGLPPLEAMASGIPVVVSNSSSLPEVCGDAAIYVDANDCEAIADGISRLLTDKILYSKHKQLSLDRAKLFSWTNTAKYLIEILESRYVK